MSPVDADSELPGLDCRGGHGRGHDDHDLACDYVTDSNGNRGNTVASSAFSCELDQVADCHRQLLVTVHSSE